MNKLQKNMSYILQFTDSARLMTSSLSNLVNNLSEGIHRIKCKIGHNDKRCKTRRIKYKYCDCFFEYRNFKDDSSVCFVTKIIGSSLMKS